MGLIKNTSSSCFIVADQTMNEIKIFIIFYIAVGASHDPCSRIFSGKSAGSEPDTRDLTKYVLNVKNQGDVIYYLAFHSFAQLIVVPYSYDNGNNSIHFSIFQYEIAIRAASKLEQRYGTSYRAGVSDIIMYKMSGTSFDWAKYHGGVSVAAFRTEKSQGLWVPFTR
ncbi:hypothetical protein ACJJTC_002314 [Scirpophaga incertulas]